MFKKGTLQSPAVWNADSFRAKFFKTLKGKLDKWGGRTWIFSGATGLLSIFYRFLIPHGIVLTSLFNGKIKLYLDSADDVMVPEILAYGCHEEEETEIFKKHLRGGMTVLDIGANVGYYTLLASDLAGPRGKVYAFEPEPVNYRILCENLKINGTENVAAFPKALSNE